MSTPLRFLGFIGARGGSKGLPEKNIRMLLDKPLITWTIDAAKKSRYLHDCVVSTDDPKIADIAKNAGADVPFLRPASLANDTAAIRDVALHGIDWLAAKENRHFDVLVLLQPTSPLRTTQHIDAAIEQWLASVSALDETLISVYHAPEKTAWVMKTNGAGYLQFCLPQLRGEIQRRQSNPPLFFPNGAIYIIPISLLQKTDFFTEKTRYYEMPSELSIDIDTLADFEAAERFLATTKLG